MDYYSELELPQDCTDEEVKAQYRRLARRYHPDLNPEDAASANERLRRLNEAYEVLSDASLRKRYDDERLAGVPLEPPPGYPAPIHYVSPEWTRSNPRRSQVRSTVIGIVMLTCLVFIFAHFGMPPPGGSGSAGSRGAIEATGNAGTVTAVPSDDPMQSHQMSELRGYMQTLQPQIDSILRQGDEAYAVLSPRFVDQSTDDGQREHDAIERLDTDLASLRSSDSAATADLAQAQSTSSDTSATKLEADMRRTMSAGSAVADDVRELRPYIQAGR